MMKTDRMKRYGMKTNWCHYFIRILPDLYMFRAHRPIFRRVRTAVHTTIGSVSVPLWSRALCVYSICWKDARYKKLKKKEGNLKTSNGKRRKRQLLLLCNYHVCDDIQPFVFLGFVYFSDFFILIYFRSRCSLFLSEWWITLLFVFGLLVLILAWNWICL